ncbi:hypothetical protein [Streptacidiphilus sp. EB129]|uniref:hypothetical protein n=1 Tax=Streptacidiphilus sp. EB129 TaxID=3156262 RepID=UPI003511E1B1
MLLPTAVVVPVVLCPVLAPAVEPVPVGGEEDEEDEDEDEEDCPLPDAAPPDDVAVAAVPPLHALRAMLAIRATADAPTAC